MWRIPGCHMLAGLGGRSPAAVTPSTLLETPTPGVRAVASLSVGDTVSHDEVDYVVEGVTSGFTDGQTWKLIHLAPTGAKAGEHWLSISPGGAELAWLDAIAGGSAGAKDLIVQGQALPLVSARSAVVVLSTGAALASGVLVKSWTYRSGVLVGLVEQWPDETLHSYGGQTIEVRDLAVTARSPSATTPATWRRYGRRRR